jgi:hypothetical protein
MRRYGLYDATRGLMTALAVGVAGFLLWIATQVGMQTTGRFWASMGIVAGAGLALTLLPRLHSPAAGLRLRPSAGTFLLGFVPTLVCVGWILMATQPGNGWHEGTVASWSRSIGIMGLVHDLGLWHGVLAFGFGAVLGLALDSVPAVERVVEGRVVEDGVVDRRAATGPSWRQRPAGDVAAEDGAAADEPLSAEREAAHSARPRTVTVGPSGTREQRIE